MTGPPQSDDGAGWHRRVWSLAGPIIVSNLSTPLLGAVDTAVVGRLPDAAYIGGVAIGAVIFSFLYWGFGFLRMGTTGFTAQAFGAGDMEELRATLLRPLMIAFALGALLILAQAPIGLAAFTLLDASSAVEGFARAYFDVRIWSAPATLTNYAVLGWLLGTRRAKTALALQVFLNGINIVLDIVFVIGLGWGVAGVAAASVIAEFAAAGLGLVIVALAAGAISVDHEVPLGHEIVLELADASAAEIPSLPELLAASQRLSGATSVSVNVAESAERGGGSTVTVLLLGDSTGRADSASPADRLVEALRELYPQLAPATVSSRELIGVFPRSLGEILGRKLFAVELGADELASARREIIRTLGDSAPADVEVETEETGGRRAIRVRIDPAE